MSEARADAVVEGKPASIEPPGAAAIVRAWPERWPSLRGAQAVDEEHDGARDPRQPDRALLAAHGGGGAHEHVGEGGRVGAACGQHAATLPGNGRLARAAVRLRARAARRR
ncbi:hypothetical protein OVA14_10715 [Agrococcus sp. SL85]|uniref:hypothetical protein n=1 Tax=Agrococcus sp. SL85 TaxID=2995141 RepID=UPI00226CEAF2|nr:hypothetical protein [Agrococcus sp. SL85]WAC65786.1 hypothetical protein OVA14_10715 [Agrococcus sp. SL85]